MRGLRIWLLVVLFTHCLVSFKLRAGKQLGLRARRFDTTTTISDRSPRTTEGTYPKKRRSAHAHTSNDRKATMEQVLQNCVDNCDSTAMTLDQVNIHVTQCL
jgi:hypothetical protein